MSIVSTKHVHYTKTSIIQTSFQNISETIVCYIVIMLFLPSYTVSGSRYQCTAHNCSRLSETSKHDVDSMHRAQNSEMDSRRVSIWNCLCALALAG